MWWPRRRHFCAGQPTIISRFSDFVNTKSPVSRGEEVLLAVEDSGLGILRGSERSLAPRSLKTLVAHDLKQTDAIIVTKTNARSRVHRPGYMDYIGILRFDKHGTPDRRTALPRPVHVVRLCATPAGCAVDPAEVRSGDATLGSASPIRIRARR